MCITCVLWLNIYSHIHFLQGLKDLKVQNAEQRVGVEIVQKACQVPCKLIADNAGHEGAVVVGNLLRHNDPSLGFNAQTGEYVNMIQAGMPKDPAAS